MKMIWNCKRVAGLGSAIAMLALVGCQSSRYERSTGEFAEDKMLGSRVKHALNAQPVYKYPDVKVNTYRGIVQLNGFVASEAQREAATEIAQRVRGVTDLQNNITVAPLEKNLVREYIPGREDNAPRVETDVNRSTGSAPSDRSVNTGSTTNTNRVNIR
jgi:hyperosmotically inducible protein